MNDVDVLFFEIGKEIYGTDASQVLRVDRSNRHSISFHPLGSLGPGGRALVFNDLGGERTLRVDLVRGVKTVATDSLRRLPAAAASPPYTVGVFLDEDRAVLLIDLLEVAKIHGKQKDHGTATSEREEWLEEEKDLRWGVWGDTN